MAHREEIDGLRAIAVVPVLFFHAGIAGFAGGFVGVDVFFVISGYLMASIVARDVSNGTFDPWAFFVRRLRRLVPALAVVLAAASALAWRGLVPVDFVSFSETLLSSALFLSNVVLWRQSGYFDVLAETKPLLHMWSLAVEMQFYVLFSVLVAVSTRFGAIGPRLRFLGFNPLAAGALVISFLGALYGAANHPAASYFLLPTRLWELFFGVLVHQARQANGAAFRRADAGFGQALAVAGLLMICAAAVLFDKSTPIPGAPTLVPVVGAGLVLAFARPAAGVGRLLAASPVVAVGLISYSLYLWHQPLLAFARIEWELQRGSPYIYVVLVAAFCLSWLSWRFVEIPARSARRVPTRWFLPAVGIATAALVALSAVGVATDGAAAYRFTPDQQALLASASFSPKRSECHTGGADFRRPRDACEYFGPDVHVALLGDSHGVELAFGLATVLQPEGIGVKHLTFSGCQPSYGVADFDDPCRTWTEEAVRDIVASKMLQNVVVTYRLHRSLFGGHEGVYPQIPEEGSDESRRKQWRALIDMIAVLRAAGKNVVFVLQAPEVHRPVGYLIVRQDDPAQDIVSVPRAWWTERTQFVMGKLAELPPGTRIVDPATLFCDETNCHATRKNASLYFDDDHMSVAGAIVVAQRVASLLQLRGGENRRH